MKLILSVGFFLLFSFSFSFPQSNLHTFPGPDVDLGETYIGRVVSGGHYIGGRGDTVYVLRELGNTYCHKSTDGGQTFGPGVQVNSVAGAFNASLKVDTAGVVYVAYQSENADIYFTKSTDGGQTFLPSVKVNDDTVATVGQERPAIATNNREQVFIVWGDRRTNPASAFMAASYNSGLTFSQNIQVNEFGTRGSYGDIATDDSGRVYVAYYGTIGGKGGIIVARSDDSGYTFTQRSMVNDSSWLTGYFSMTAVQNGIVGVAWEGFQDTCTYVLCSIHLSVSVDFGQTFSSSILLDNSGQPQRPSLSEANDIFYTLWRAYHRRSPSEPLLDHMWLSYSHDSGKTFEPFVDAVPDDTNLVTHFNPTIWVNETEKAFVAWSDTRWDPWFEESHHLFVSTGKPVLSKGDLNFDGIINGLDLVLEMNAVFLGLPFPAPAHRADLNCDGKLTAVDMVLFLYKWYLDRPFPCS